MVLRWSSMTARRTGSTGCGGGRLEQQEEHSRSNTNKPSIEGTAAVVARRLGRVAVGFEARGDYLDIAARRIERSLSATAAQPPR